MEALEETDIAIEKSELQWQARTADRRYMMRKDYFVKGELRRDELVIRREDGAVLEPVWSEERMRNEHAAMKFVKKHTTIPVPWHAVYCKNGLLQLATKRVQAPGAIKLADVTPPERLAQATLSVERQMYEDVIPQLRVLRRRYIGSVDQGLPVIPPPRLYHSGAGGAGHHYARAASVRARPWPQIEARDDEGDFVFCHNDLSPQNIFVDSENFHIRAIIDWEYAGFFPPSFEIPLWRAVSQTQKQVLYASTRVRDLAFFGLRPQDVDPRDRDQLPQDIKDRLPRE